MKIIVSPTKTMKRKDYNIESTSMIFKDKAQRLRTLMQKKSKDELKTSLKISDNITEQVAEYYYNPQAPIEALNLYEGAAFKAMNIGSWSDEDIQFFNNHAYILSAMYGALRPSDEIIEYRLDYLNGLDINLYEYWQESLDELFETEDLILNLASQEFSKGLDQDKLLNIHFLDKKGRNLSTQAKQGRGDMVQYIVKNKIINPADLKKYNHLDYVFQEDKSDESNYYFQKM